MIVEWWTEVLLRVLFVIGQLNQETCLLSRNAEEMYEGIEIVPIQSTKKASSFFFLCEIQVLIYPEYLSHELQKSSDHCGFFKLKPKPKVSSGQQQQQLETKTFNCLTKSMKVNFS